MTQSLTVPHGGAHPLPGPFASPRIAVRFFLDNPFAADLSALTPVFHDLVVTGVGGERLVDLTSYAQVPRGPGLLLVGAKAHYALTDGPRASLVRVQRSAWDAPARVRVLEAIRRTLELGERIASDRRTPAGFALRTDEIEIAVHDRMYAPNTRASFERGAPVLASILSQLYDDDVEIAPTGVTGEPFTLRVRAPRRELAWLTRRAS